MKNRIRIGLCALAICLFTACPCAYTQGEANSTYTFSYANSDGTTTSGEFTTNEYGQANFDVPDNIDCNKVTVTKKEEQKVAMVEGGVY